MEQDESQSAQLNEIKTRIRAGIPITHILNIKVSKEPNNAIGNQIQRQFFTLLNQVPQTRTVALPNFTGNIQITWETPGNIQTSAYYYTQIPFGTITDRVVALHTKQVFSNIIYSIKQTSVGQAIRDMEGYNGQWGISFFISKPLTYEMPLRDDFFTDIFS
eukprot:c14227_g1_i1.p1 GENE.c14227_g1_i1~~c14227_g1_i1.p1  ORF type:complete len:161 (+),score=32.72 c14227_g1_i1:175-657(+)